MSLALYRTYRPGSLAEVIGQEHVTVPLGRALDSGKAHHAYLFTGPRGCGKTSTARILARSLNCEKGPTSTPCGTCRSCIELAPNGPGSLDVIELDAASHRTAEEARDLRERAAFGPAGSRYKIYIIDEAHQLTDTAAQTLLKLVEEPPPHLFFVFATTEADKILATIKSRTHHYPFRLVPQRRLQEHLAWVCEQENVKAEPAALGLVARAGAGSVRDAMSVLGQVAAGAGPDGIVYDDVVEQLGVTDESLLDSMVAAIAAQNGTAMFQLVDHIVEGGLEPRRFATDLLERLRDIVVLTHVPNAFDSGLLNVPDGTREAMTAQANALGAARASRAADLVSAGISELKGATAPRLQLELLCARLLLPGADDSFSGVLARLDALERRSAGLPAATAAPAAKPAAEAPVAPPRKTSAPAAPAANTEVPPPPPPLSQVTAQAMGAPAGKTEAVAAAPSVPQILDINGVKSMWPAVLEALKASSRVAWTAFEQSQPVSMDSKTLAVALPDQGRITFARNGGHDERLRQALIDVLKADLAPDLILDPSKSKSTPAVKKSAKKTAEPVVEMGDADLADRDVASRSGINVVTGLLGGTVIETRENTK